MESPVIRLVPLTAAPVPYDPQEEKTDPVDSLIEREGQQVEKAETQLRGWPAARARRTDEIGHSNELWVYLVEETTLAGWAEISDGLTPGTCAVVLVDDPIGPEAVDTFANVRVVGTRSFKETTW